jgi:hypothetical protein
VSKINRRYYRTILLGVAALAALVWVAVDQFGIPWGEMLELFLTTLLVLSVFIAAAGLLVGFWLGLRKLLHRDTREP